MDNRLKKKELFLNNLNMIKGIRKYTKYDIDGNETHYYFNPIIKRSIGNLNCSCESGKKYKKCCANINYLSKNELESLLSTHLKRTIVIIERKNNPISLVKS